MNRRSQRRVPRHAGPGHDNTGDEGIEACQLDEPDLAIEPVHELAVIRNLVHHCGNEPGLGVQAGKRVTVGMLGVWGLAMVSARTTREVIDIAARFGYGRFSWVTQLRGHGISVRDVHTTSAFVNPINARYLHAKTNRNGHRSAYA